MYALLLTFHSVFRYAVLLTLLWSVYRAVTGLLQKSPFTKSDNALRHWTATIAHIQLMAGIILYTQSPIVKHYFSGEGDNSGEPLFFGLVHIFLMLVAIIVITIGSAKAKRQSEDKDKFRTIAMWFGAGLLLIFIAIPWPFSSLANRPLIRL